MRLIRILSAAAMPVLGASLACAQTVVGEMYATDASVRGSVLFSGGGTRIESGSSVIAGDAPAAVKLSRGGEVRICPRTGVNVTASASGRDLMIAMNTGAIEAHYTLGTSADTIMTPDFRILLAGPGIFHFAISADLQGNVCVRALPHNTASLIVTELNGDGTYQVKPTVQVLFKNGKIGDPSPLIPPGCGCPPAPEQPLRAAEPPKPAPPPPTPPPAVAKETPPAAPTHLEMDAPFVYQGDKEPYDIQFQIARLRLTEGSIFKDREVLPPPAPAPAAPQTAVVNPPKSPPKKGFFAKMKSFLGSIFK